MDALAKIKQEVKKGQQAWDEMFLILDTLLAQGVLSNVATSMLKDRLGKLRPLDDVHERVLSALFDDAYIIPESPVYRNETLVSPFMLTKLLEGRERGEFEIHFVRKA